MVERQLVAYSLIVLLALAITAFLWGVKRTSRRQAERDDRHLRIDLNAGSRPDSSSPNDSAD